MKPLHRPASRRAPETLVALVDVVFFLLVFALLIGRMDATAPFRVTPPTAISGTDLPAGGHTVSVGTDGALALDGTATPRDALLQNTRALLIADPETQIRINADGATALQHVLPLVEQLNTSGATNIVLIVTPDAG